MPVLLVRVDMLALLHGSELEDAEARGAALAAEARGAADRGPLGRGRHDPRRAGAGRGKGQEGGRHVVPAKVAEALSVHCEVGFALVSRRYVGE